MGSRRTFTIRTLGCKANQYDSQLLREGLLGLGLVECAGEGEADVCIVNTCTVTAQSDAKSRQTIRALKRHNPRARIVVTGCYAHVNPQEVGSVDGVDAVFDNPSKKTLVGRICDLLKVSRRGTETPLSRISFFFGHTRVFVKIQDGCSKRCSYCIVPAARGGSRSRSIAHIVSEIKHVVANGCREVVLTGIHIGDFGATTDAEQNKLPELIQSLQKIEGLCRVRLSSIDPNEIDGRLIAAMQASPQICSHLHIPLQSGSDVILRRMNREYTGRSYLHTIALLRQKLPDISITTDVMVGFPGETEDDFRRSRHVVCQAEFSKVHIFPFSSRPGTAAHRLPSHVSAGVIRDRIARLSADADAAALKSRQRWRGRVVEVLVERELRPSEKDRSPALLENGKTPYEGFSSNYLRAVFLGDGGAFNDLRNRIVRVNVESFDARYLYGRRL
jgi:threonylcarbamoyladenosine tRNA methylthiotransferase MtaB